jgi:hypothetical protein
MPTVPRRPAAQRERDQLKARRLRGRPVGPRRPPGRGRPPVRRLRPSRGRLVCALADRRGGGISQLRTKRPGAQAVGCPARHGPAGLARRRRRQRVVGELWTLNRIALVIARLTGVRHHPAYVWALRHRLGWTVQRPRRCAAERDQAAIDRWVTERWPWIKQTPGRMASMAGALCYGARGGAQLCFHSRVGHYDTERLIQMLGALRRSQAAGRPPWRWDGLPAHRSTAMRTWLNTQRSWLVVERLPVHAPELNPVEGCGPTARRSSSPTSPRPSGRGDRPGPPGDRAGAPPAAAGLLVAAACRPVRLLPHQPNPSTNPKTLPLGI